VATQSNPGVNLNLILDQVAKDKGIDRSVLIATLEDAMKTAAKDLEFEKAALLRDQIRELKRALEGSKPGLETKATQVSYRRNRR